MNWRAEVRLGQRVARGESCRRATIGALCVIALSSPSLAFADADSPRGAAASDAARAFPKRLALTVVADERQLVTFQQRISSWFTDGTEVRVTVASEVDQPQLLASSPGEVRAWIVPLSAESALLIFSCVSPPAAPRHLLREVHLRSGFDELGLERLASVTHSAFVALSQGSEGVEREQAEQELGAVGVAAGALAPPSAAEPPVVPTPPRPPTTPPTPQTRRAPPVTPPPKAPSPSSLLVAAGYGVRLRGVEGVGHGPSVAVGLQLRGARMALDLQLSGQYLLPSDFDAPPFRASVQTSALRFQVGIEPQLEPSLYGQALLGLGADIAHISARAISPSTDGVLLEPRANGTQVRSTGELSLGIVRRGDVLDLGIVAQVIFALQDVQYAATGDGEAFLVAPWPVQPALMVQGRFRNAL